ncbi:MAG: transketolase [Candidatus Dasytiphilus stammeri]
MKKKSSSRQRLANIIRILSIDAIEKAQSGHPGAPMGMADIAEVLWRKYLNHNPNNPAWCNRDRFVLSNGHASMLIYSLLHLTGYNLPLSEIKKFRQLYSKTPGHPEYLHTPGVETTTGPLGQGLANAVGMAIAEKTLAAQFNQKEHIIVDHYTYVFVGDGCLMEGISHEVCSLAGTLKIGKLIVFYDKNGISIDGPVSGWFTDNTAKRFESYGWHVINKVDGHDSVSISKAIQEAKNFIFQPSIIICTTIIGFGSINKAGTNKIHGSPLGTDELKITRNYLQWFYPAFFIPKEIYAKWDAKEVGSKKEEIWKTNFSQYKKSFPKLASEFLRRQQDRLPSNWHKNVKNFIKQLHRQPDHISGRQASQKTLHFLGKMLPEILGGSADLTSSNLTFVTQSKALHKNNNGNYIHYGVREFGMTAIANGIALHKGFLPYTGTFLIFEEYARNAVRMASLMKIHQIFIYTHDSIGIGEDGPTHQPIEQLASLRMTPNLTTWRPCDQVETAVSWKYAIENHEGPTALILSRQILYQQERSLEQINYINKGAYILKKSLERPDVILIATGSEIQLATSAYISLTNEGYKVQVVSMPSPDVFDKQNDDYKQIILPTRVIVRIAIEAGIKDYWYKYIGLHGSILGINSFGKSGPANKIFYHFGLTVEKIIQTVKKLLQNTKKYS